LFAAYLATFLTAVGQVLLKVSADRTAGKGWRALYGNPLSLSAYLLLAMTTLVNLYAYSTLPLKFATMVLPFNYVFVGLFSCLLLGERLTRAQWLGAAVILAGIAVFNT
jgi:drug/metabolite transporter (DMT)-like permease